MRSRLRERICRRGWTKRAGDGCARRQPYRADGEAEGSYSRILRSASLLGSAQGVLVVVGMIRLKAAAVFIGPLGVGLLSTYQAALELIVLVSGLGLPSSAVREIAESSGRGNQGKTARVVCSLRRVSWLSGGLGAMVAVGFARQISCVTFGSPGHAGGIRVLGLAVLLVTVQGGRMAVIQGMRRIGDLARANVCAGVLGAIVSVGLYAWLGLAGVVPAIVLVAAVQLGSTWWFARRALVDRITMTWGESFRAAGGMVKLGLALMWCSALAACVAYLCRLMIAREVDVAAVGVFAAAFGVSGKVVNFILGAMVADYYPGLSALSGDHGAMRELVDRQTEIGLLLAFSGVLATIVLAPWIVRLLYSEQFGSAAGLLQWFSLGCLGRVLSWPMGFVVVAKGRVRLFSLLEACIHLLHLALIRLLLELAGLEGVAIAYFVLYAIVAVLMSAVARRMIGYSWSRSLRRLVLGMGLTAAFVLVCCRCLPSPLGTGVGMLTTIVACLACLRAVVSRLGPEHRLSRIARRLRLAAH